MLRIDAETRQVTVGTREELGRGTFFANRVNWLIDEPSEPFACLVQIRYNSRPSPGMVEPLPGGRLRIVLDEPKDGVAPGQAAVCYDDDRVLGGGWIE